MRALLRLSRFGLVLVGLVFLIQTNAMAHALEHGDEPHEHEGVSCELELITTQAVVVLPAIVPVYTPAATPPIRIGVTVRPTFWTWPPGRAPPPRGPPAIT